MENRPRIGITSGLASDDWAPAGETWRSYAEAIEGAGGIPVHLNPRTIGRERAVLSDLEGIVFAGGKDIHLSLYPNPPELFGEAPEAVMERFRMRPEPDRDSYELPLMREALERDLPVLGICRGCQVLNVALGGRLILDIPLEVETRVVHRLPETEPLAACHTLEIRFDTLLHSILPRETYRECNSRHHQAIRVDEAFTARISAVCPEDGLVEAIEVEGRRWVVGVQWHPEHPRDPGIRERYAPLFQAFVQAAAAT